MSGNITNSRFSSVNALGTPLAATKKLYQIQWVALVCVCGAEAGLGQHRTLKLRFHIDGADE